MFRREGNEGARHDLQEEELCDRALMGEGGEEEGKEEEWSLFHWKHKRVKAKFINACAAQVPLTLLSASQFKH